MELNTTIDRNSYVPLYAQVQEALKEYLSHDGARPGDQLPSEPELCRLFDVSRTVVRHALRGLESEGLIVRHKGKGTFIAQPKIGESLFQELTGFFQDMARRGHRPFSRVLRQQVIPAGPKIATYLQLDPDTLVVRIDRLRYVEDEPIVFVTTYLPHALCPSAVEADLSERSLYELLEEEHGITIARGRRILEAVIATEHEAQLLEIPEGSALISLDSISYLEDGTPIEYYHALHRGDRSMFEVELIRDAENAPMQRIVPDQETDR